MSSVSLTVFLASFTQRGRVVVRAHEPPTTNKQTIYNEYKMVLKSGRAGGGGGGEGGRRRKSVNRSRGRETNRNKNIIKFDKNGISSWCLKIKGRTGTTFNYTRRRHVSDTRNSKALMVPSESGCIEVVQPLYLPDAHLPPLRLRVAATV